MNKLTSASQHSDYDQSLAQPSKFFGLLGICLPALFVISVLGVILPLRILDPGWQLRFGAVLVERGPLALLGVAMSHLASIMNPGDVKLRAKRNALVRFARLAVIGYVLIIPLQLSAVWRSTIVLSQQQSSRIVQARQNLQLMRQQIEIANSFQDIQTRLTSIQAPNLPIESATLLKPLPEIKAALLTGVDQAERVIERQWQANNQPARLWDLVQSSFVTVLAAIIEAVVFAAAAPQEAVPFSLLRPESRWKKSWKKKLQRLSSPFW
jgi:hypothetical protein